MQPPVGLAVIGAGSIGKRHIDHVLAEGCAALAAIVDPSPEASALAERTGASWYADIAAMLRDRRPEGAIVATPTQLHAANGLACVSAGVPVLVEKPIADTVAAGTALVEAAERAGVPLLVGHHRRHNPLLQAAKHAIEAGGLGRIVAVQATFWLYKPESYFAPAWRRAKGAGPVLTNLIHDVDLLRFLCGEIVSVQAFESNAVRGNAVEDTAAILLRFASGALGTLTGSDTIPAPWSWEFTSGESPAFTQTGESFAVIGGTLGSLTLPHLDLWQHPGAPDWMQPIVPERLPVEAKDPLGLQVRNFCAVIRGAAAPVVSGREGLNTLKVVEAVKRAAATGQATEVG